MARGLCPRKWQVAAREEPFTRAPVSREAWFIRAARRRSPLGQGTKQRISFCFQGLDLVLELHDPTDRCQRHSLIGEPGDVLHNRPSVRE